ncbi:class I SAM-dependent methyltransferase [Rothia nasisuis]|uniref:class I SAM-dependent methyltransferase n=1 Tax=Rothia nasisuis TaxID=2109647 RepID=UPI001F47CD1F|nr:class I SAM-dependent methyltransferase [Rothia nasisuis]
MRGFFEKDVLDVGTGTGDILCRWSHLANSVCGIDLSHAMLEQAEKVIDKSRVKLYQADFMKDLSWLGVFDVVISNRGSLACVLSPEQLELALKNISAVISPGGKLVVEMYSYLAYKKISESQKIPFAFEGLRGVMFADICGDILYFNTRLDESPVGEIQFAERVILLPVQKIINIFARAGFVYDEEGSFISDGDEAFDWLVFDYAN